VEDGKGSLAAAVLDVSRNELFQAGRGLGATLNGSRIEVSREGTLARALLATGFPYDIWTAPERPLGLLDIFIRRCQGIRRAGSAALDLCWVACGRYDGFFEVKLKPWDLAGGTLVVREAGGEVGDLMGGPVDYSVCDVLASNGRLHRDMVELARQVPPHGR
jgi:myo-inositol-1(or 4)-monophosphatase